MNSLFKIEKYKDNNKILVKFSDSVQTIDDAPSRIIDCRVLDTTDPHSFISSLMKLYGDGYIIDQNRDLIQPENIRGELDIKSLEGKIVNAKINYRRELLRMREIEL